MKWIIVFYQVFVTIPDGEIFFSGLENGKNLIKSDQMLNSYYSSKSDCEKTLTKLKGQNNILEVNSFYNKKAKIVTNKVPLINKKRIVVNAFQCLNIDNFASSNTTITFNSKTSKKTNSLKMTQNRL